MVPQATKNPVVLNTNQKNISDEEVRRDSDSGTTMPITGSFVVQYWGSRPATSCEAAMT